MITKRHFEKDEFVVEAGRPLLIIEVERRIEGRPELDRFKCQAVDGSTYSNIPAYGMRDATEAEIKAALAKAGRR